jgi:hypothetical protein
VQLIINSSWSGVRGTITCRVQLTEEEQDLVERYELGAIVISAKAGYNPDPHSLADLIRGVTIQTQDLYPPHVAITPNVGVLFSIEDQLMESCDPICNLLARCRSLDDGVVVQYPRDDRTIDVRVKNTVYTREA